MTPAGINAAIKKKQWPMKKAGMLFPFKDRLQKVAKVPLMTGCSA